MSQCPSPSDSRRHSPDNRIDPSDVYPEQWHPYLPRILDHYLSNMAPDIPDLDGPEAKGLLRSRFFPFSLTDAASLHAVMLMAAAHYGNVWGPRSHTIDILQLRGMAIREINGALHDPGRATSDQQIAAVALLASYEALFGDRNIFHTHMTGLVRMARAFTSTEQPFHLAYSIPDRTHIALQAAYQGGDLHREWAKLALYLRYHRMAAR
ncbi:hypothetical protein LTR37_015649 [Vermiconidia calcicola]|uniref:Uncharacterized protein n=1 Tax=Vermiconidia calcicola TaxID=1690605 RepID=A0ACC3MQ80_9PEZI|nr:hypothetical protein LTR37_015649 [Vermiconidia calcicola]